jgi:hypothetical protein
MARVIFYGTCAFAGCDMPPHEEELDIDRVNLEDIANDLAQEWCGVEGWYEVIEDEESE